MAEIESDDFVVLDCENDPILMTAFPVEHLAEFGYVAFVFAGGSIALGKFTQASKLAFEFLNPTKSTGWAVLRNAISDILQV